MTNKRDIFRFNGGTPTALNLEHVTCITQDGKRINFHFYSNLLPVDMESEEVATATLEQILISWVQGVQEQ